tara:strand:+ start:577 stop:828 length:252 start_codon:yes stop_codon:yes gene_type:complete
MPKGVKYELTFKKDATQSLVFNNMNMKDLISKIKELYIELFDLEIKIDNMTVSNLMLRPQNVNLLIKSFVSIKKITSKPLEDM